MYVSVSLLRVFRFLGSDGGVHLGVVVAVVIAVLFAMPLYIYSRILYIS